MQTFHACPHWQKAEKMAPKPRRKRRPRPKLVKYWIEPKQDNN